MGYFFYLLSFLPETLHQANATFREFPKTTPEVKGDFRELPKPCQRQKEAFGNSRNLARGKRKLSGKILLFALLLVKYYVQI